ncbi:MAG: nucleotidyltransferase domain-containing protein [Actinobacteria bacterium]|nr:nucleotidyltransferase domain-containing protein [Actinomycetota bacterium]
MGNFLREKRSEILEVAARHGAGAVRVFGSVARGQEGPTSDADFLVEFEPGRGFIDQGLLVQDLQKLHPCWCSRRSSPPRQGAGLPLRVQGQGGL